MRGVSLLGQYGSCQTETSEQVTVPLQRSQRPGLFLLYTYVGGGVSIGFCLGPVLRLGTGRSLLRLPGERSPSQWGHLTRGGWNVVTWPADPGLIRAEQGHREKEQADTARQYSKQIQTHMLPERQHLLFPPRSSGLLSSQARTAPSFLPSSAHLGHRQHQHGLTWWGEVQV